MKKNKKLFISFFFILLGITPNFIALNSCKKQPSLTIKYGDTINCLDPKKNNYISVEDLKKAIKNHFVVNPPCEFTNDEFKNLTKEIILKKGDYTKKCTIIEEMYFEFIMSLIEHENKGFELKWNCPSKYVFNNIEITTNSNKKNIFVSAQYIWKDKNIYLNLGMENGTRELIKSYKFKHCQIK